MNRALNSFCLDVYLLGLVLLSVAFAGVGFVFHCAVSPIPFWLAFALLNIFAMKTGLRHAAVFSFTVVILFVVTAYTFGYTQIDGVEYHTPMQLLLKNGWNPIYDARLEYASVDPRDGWPYHILFLPKFNALCGALLSKVTGLWIANGFLNFALMIVVLVTSFRFAQAVWSCRGLPAGIFAVGMAFGRQVSSIQTGEVDYIVYAAFVSAIFSGWMLIERFEVRDTMVFLSSIAIGVLTKSTAIIWSMGMISFITFVCWREGRIRQWSGWLVALLVVCLIAGASPYLVNWINYGSPLYPNHTFSTSVQVVDITSDFTGNSDFLSMGYLFRVSYAWVSPEWTIRLLRVIRNMPDFSPVTTIGQGGAAGMGAGFRVLLGISLLCFAMSRRSPALLIGVFTFCVSNCAPVKYIGYSRYFPQMWIVPFLAVFNLVYLPRERVQRIVSRMRSTVLVVLAITVGGMVFRHGILHLRMMVLEGMRQDAIAEAGHLARSWSAARPCVVQNSGVAWFPYYTPFGYTMRSRLQVGGVQLDYGNAALPCFDKDPMLIPCWSGMRVDYVDLFGREYPAPDSWKNICRFNWIGALRWLPHPVWSL